MKYLITLLILAQICLSSLFSATLYTSLSDLISLVSHSNKIDIIVDDDLNKKNFFFFFNESDHISIKEFSEILKHQNLFLNKKDDIYIVSDKFLLQPDLRIIKLDNYVSDEISQIIERFDLNVTYSKSSNALFFRSNEVIYNEILKASKVIDKAPEMANFKIIVTETNLKDIKDRGTDLTALLKPINHTDLSFFINLLTSPYMNNNNIIKNNQSSYFGVLNFLDTNGITKIISSPFITAFNNNLVEFSSVTNIPYLTSTSQISNATSQNTSNYTYKDVGLKLSLLPIFLKNGIRIDLHLIIEDILNENTLTPTTSKKELKSSYFLQRGEILVLSGIKKTQKQNLRNGIPILKDIFILKYLFSVEQEVLNESILTLSIQAI